MVTWKEFAAAERDLAETGRSLLLHKSGVGLAFLATVRKDGAPRLHPLCPVLSDDRLFVLITPASPAHGGARHDPGCFSQASLRRRLMRTLGGGRHACHMTEKADLLERRFRVNMDRISGLVQLLSSNDTLKPTTVFGPSAGARA